MFTATLFLLLIPAAPQAKTHANPDLLIEPAELAKAENLKKFRILDARSSQQYQAGHVAGALWLDVNQWKKSFKGPEDAAGWGERIGALGIGDVAQPIVLYGDQPETARMWWIMRFWGFKDVRLLNGGFSAWQANKGVVAKGAQPNVAAAKLKLTPAVERLATKEFLLKALGEKSHAIIDSRTHAEHTGAKAQAKKGGTIPESCHLDWVEVIDKKTQRFKSADELERLFKDAGIDPRKANVTFCQSGGRASVMAFALELMGANNVRNYYSSWAEWGNADDTPIVTPKKK